MHSLDEGGTKRKLDNMKGLVSYTIHFVVARVKGDLTRERQGLNRSNSLNWINLYTESILFCSGMLYISLSEINAKRERVFMSPGLNEIRIGYGHTPPRSPLRRVGEKQCLNRVLTKVLKGLKRSEIYFPIFKALKSLKFGHFFE